MKESSSVSRGQASALPLSPEQLPKHIAIIMDGNNRWARQRRRPGVAGHKAGVDAVRAVVEACGEQGIPYLTLFAFSSENWQRPVEEVSALMELFGTVLNRETRRLHENNVRVRVIGDRSRFSVELQDGMRVAEELTAGNTALTVIMAMNYGGRWDMAQACRKAVQDVQAGHCTVDQLDETKFGSYLSLADVPDPDLCIRTGGDHRISNFLLWQFAYAELYFTDEFWPDFRGPSLIAALQNYAQRQRRFGLSAEQVEASKR